MRSQLTSRSVSPLSTPRALGLLLAVCAAGIAPGVAFAQSGAPKDSGGKDNGSYGPIVAIVSPEYADVLKGETKIVIAVQPRRYPTQGVELLVDGKAVTGVLDPGTSFRWKTALFLDGPHTLGVRVTDTQGFIGQAETMVYINNARKTDNSAPILRWSGVENGQKLSGITNVRVEAGDNFGVKYVFLTVNSAITPDIKPPIASWIINRPPYEVSIDTTRFKNGMYVLDALAFDATENERSAQRLTLNFSNDVSVAPEADAPIENPAPKNPDSNNAGNSVAPSTKQSPLIAPPRVATVPRVVTSPQVTVTEKGYIASTPAPTTSQVPMPTAPRITTNALASRPPLAVTAPGVKSTAPAVKMTAPTPAPTMQPLRIAKAQSELLNQAPSVSVAGQNGNANASAIATKSLNNQRLAVAPEIRWTTPNAFRSSAKSSGTASTTLSAHSSPPSAWSTPSLPSAGIAPLTSETRTMQLTAPQPAAVTIKLPTNPNAQLSQSTLAIGPNTRIASIESNRTREPRAVVAVIAALPTNAASQNKNVQAAKVQTVRTTSVSKSQDARRVFTAPLSATRVAAAESTPSLPTAPRLAFSPNLSQPSAPAPLNAAIVVSHTTDAPIVHIAQNNETLAAIAKKYKMPVSVIATANNLKANAKVVKGEKVLLPQALLVSYQGQAVTGDVAPLLIGSTSVAPFRFLFEKQGGTMNWDATGQRITARNANYEVNLEIGSDIALVNKKEVMMDMAAFLLSGRTMVPVRFFEKALQAKVEWEPSTGRIFVAMTP